MRVDIKRTDIYKEFDSETNKEFFNTKGECLIENVDTLYYNVFLVDDVSDNKLLNPLLECLGELKEIYKDTLEEQFYKDLEIKLGSYSIYTYRLSSPDLFDIFISDYLPNKKTARIVIQLRSYGLWLHGVDKMLQDSFDKLNEILKEFGLAVSRTLENRFDYCYHTNMIQNGENFFSDDKLKKHLITTMNTYSKVGDCSLNTNVETRNLTIDYFSLGHRNSNNVFIRIYNKTREVVEMGYKAFFFKIWYDEGLISFYDKYCLEIAYSKQNYESLELAKLHFYLDYGTNENIKIQIRKLISDKNSRYKDFRDFCKGLLPLVTVINNIEYETKRRFYYFSDKQIDFLPTSCCNELKRIYQIYHNRSIFLKYLMTNTMYFVKNVSDPLDYMTWWNRVINKKLSNVNKNDTELIREYSSEIDLEKAFNRSVNSIATTNLYKNNIETDLLEDFSSVLSLVNDNDLMTNTRLAFVDSVTGEIIESIDNKLSIKYKEYKSKKYSQLKNRLSSSPPQADENS